MNKLIVCASIAGVCGLCYLLFEPVFVYNFGWKPLNVDHRSRTEVIYDSSYLNSISQARGYMEDSVSLVTPALSLAVGIEGKLVWASSSGFSIIEEKTNASPNTAYRIGSTSKAVTSIGLGILMEQNRIDLNDTLSRDVIEEDVTIRQLASHTSGIRNYGMCFCFPVWEYYNNDEYSSAEAAVTVFRDDPLLYEPGSDFSYSSYNYTALSAAMQRAAGTDFDEFMENNVFQKSGMTSTTFDKKDVTIDRAKFYDIKTNQYKEAFEVDNSNKWAGGGMLSTPSDLVKLGNSILTEVIINREIFDRLTTPVKLSNGEVNEQNYAIGWRVGEVNLHGNTVKIMHHGGTAMGSTALWIIIPDYKLTAALMINRSVEGFPLFEILIPIAESFIPD